MREMGGLDIVMDDGSHVATHQRVSFETLFPLLADGGLYLIEDTHTSYWSYFFEGGWRRKGTAIEFCKGLIDAMHRHYREEGVNTSDAIPEIESIQFFDSIIAIRKKRQLPRMHITGFHELNTLVFTAPAKMTEFNLTGETFCEI